MRLPGYDYSQTNAYFVTICTYQRARLFGEIQEGVMDVSTFGLIVAQVWNDIPSHYPDITLDAFIVMPDHIHGIVLLSGQHTLSQVVGAFKAASTRLIRIQQPDLSSVPIWQSNYYDHIIRNDADLNTKRAYIEGNPQRWMETHRS